MIEYIQNNVAAKELFRMNIEPSIMIRRMEARVKLQSKLLVAEKQVVEGGPLTDHNEVIIRMRNRIKASKE